MARPHTCCSPERLASYAGLRGGLLIFNESQISVLDLV
jgi:hypothetical protein